MAQLLAADLIDGSARNVSGKTFAESLAGVANKNPEVIRPMSAPYQATGGLAVLYGNLAQNGSVVKQSAVSPKMLTHKGPARVFESEEEAIDAIYGGRIHPGDVVVIRYEGPRGGPGMREMLSPTSAIVGMGLGEQVALITDGRFSGAPAARPSATFRPRPPPAEPSRWSGKATKSRSTSPAGDYAYRCRRRSWPRAAPRGSPSRNPR